jgi:hypothetical protein
VPERCSHTCKDENVKKCIDALSCSFLATR